MNSVCIEVWLRLDKAMEAFDNFPITNDNKTYAANAGSILVCRLKVYCCKVIHRVKGSVY